MGRTKIISVVVFAFFANFVCGQVAVNAGDTAWVLTSSALVLVMTPAVGLFYGGMVRRKNVLSILTQSIVVVALVSLQWVLVGYTLSFGSDIGGFIGDLSHAGLSGVGMAPNPAYGSTIPALAFMVFQAMFAIITPALIIGSFADRMKFSAFIAFILLWTTLVYDPIAHWVWGGGWLGSLGALDFAGGTVVHISAGVSALVAALVIGRRIEFNTDGAHMLPHHIPMTIIGASLLWFGWFGFNAGSALAADGLAAHAFVTTNTAAAAAALSWMLASWFRDGKPSALGIVTGGVCGLVAITPAAGFVSPIAAILIGAIAGAACYFAVVFMKNYTKVDDALDVLACHGFGGMIGAVLTGVFAQKSINPSSADGLIAGNAGLVVTQVIAVVSTVVYAFVVTFVILKVLDALMGLRVAKNDEVIGLDLTQHGEEAYPFADIPN